MSEHLCTVHSSTKEQIYLGIVIDTLSLAFCNCIAHHDLQNKRAIIIYISHNEGTRLDMGNFYCIIHFDGPLTLWYDMP